MSHEMSSCPTCGDPVDSLRARSVSVRDGKVVAYCSAECARAAESRPIEVPAAARVESPRSATPRPAAPRPATPSAGIPSGTSPQLETGPVIEVVREPSAKGRADTTLGRWSQSDDEVAAGAATSDAEPASSDAGGTTSLRPRRAPLVIAVVVLLGGAGAFLAYRYLISDRGASARSVSAPVRAPVATPAPPPDAPPVPSPADSVARARGVLTQNLDAGTPRVQRVAAAALARTGDARSIEVLAEALAGEKIEVARLELAYALARSGDERGTKVLVAGIGSGRRDIKAQAGRLLALLGDDRAVRALSPYLGVTQLRLGAAEQLAYLAEPRALEVLVQVRADAQSSPDDRARATIALGFAGRSDVTPDLHQLLTDARFNAFAASALARLGDAAARPVLIEQLAIPSLRVEAARSLRRLEPGFDPAPQLPALLAALGSLKDTEQVQAAEAVLLLAGDAAWSERP